MSFDFIPSGENKAVLDLLVQVGVLLSFTITFISFIVRYFNKKLDTKIDVKIDKVDNTLREHSKSVEALFKSKEEVDRERFRNLKEHVTHIEQDALIIKDKVESHLVDASRFIGSTNERLTNIERQNKNQ